MMMKKTLLAAGLATLLLAACGGGDDDDHPAPTAQVPASAGESIDGFVAYLKALVVSEADTLEPVNIGALTPPADDTTPPTPIE
jgi:ABC-type glycerol-3-phosphate transport system substrate-binding protein